MTVLSKVCNLSFKITDTTGRARHLFNHSSDIMPNEPDLVVESLSHFESVGPTSEIVDAETDLSR